jgi:hypothetical protein
VNINEARHYLTENFPYSADVPAHGLDLESLLQTFGPRAFRQHGFGVFLLEPANWTMWTESKDDKLVFTGVFTMVDYATLHFRRERDAVRAKIQFG